MVFVGVRFACWLKLRKDLIGGIVGYLEEEISKKDWVAFGIEDVNRRHFIDDSRATYWILNRDNGCYLRKVFNGRDPDTMHQSIWHFYYKSKLFIVDIESSSENREGEIILYKTITKVVPEDRSSNISIELKKEIEVALMSHSKYKVKVFFKEFD